MPEFHVIIPARFGSSRLPGKPLREVAGRPMLAHVYDRACESGASRIIIATDDERIMQAAHEMGAEVVMTRSDHASGTDRVHEVVTLTGWADDVCVVNLQGDEPMLPACLIDQVAVNLENHAEASIATLAEPIMDWPDMDNPNVVKVVRDVREYALYFSRAPIPWARDSRAAGAVRWPAEGEFLRHVGLYAYRVGFLHEFVCRPPAVIESLECLEQLRALYAGARIHVDLAACPLPAGVDTEEDLLRVRRFMGELV